MKQYSIRNIEELTGIKAHTIRMWEKRYNIVEPQRTDTNIRYYTEKDVKKLIYIATLQKFGYKISELAKLSLEELYENLLIINNSEKILNKEVDTFYSAVFNFDPALFEKLFYELVISYGFTTAFTNAIYPFVNKIELAYDTQAITALHRAFAFSNLKKLLFNTFNRRSTASSDKKFVLFTDTDTTNLFLLLFAAYIVAKKDKYVIFVGELDEPDDLFENIESFETQHFITTAFKFKKHNDAFLENIDKHKEKNFFVLDPLSKLEESERINLFLVRNIADLEKEIF